MIKRILFSVLFFSCCLLASPLSAQAKDILGSSAECNTASAGTGSSAICTDNTNTLNANKHDDPVADKLRDITKIVAFVSGAAAIILILVGSIQYVTSAGDSNKITGARDTIIYALIGLIVIVLAVSIIEFVLNKI
jgi:heme A synthase